MPCNLVSGSEHHVLEGPPKIVSSGEKINVPVYNRLDYQEPAVWSKSVVTKWESRNYLQCDNSNRALGRRLSNHNELNSRPSTMQPLKSLKAGV